jgi:pheromone shutdown-related protein TraB
MTLNLDGREITLIGTAHVSRESINEVGRVIGERRPDLVCVELDSGRYASMSQKESWEKLNVIKVFREGKGFLLMANLTMASFQRRLGQELGVTPGEEMRMAVSAAEALGIPYVFCDREVQVTLRRAWARSSLWNKCKLLASLLASAFTTEKLSEAEIENLKNRNELDGMMAELAAYLPPVKATLIDERDRYLALKIWTASMRDKKLVAVVGAGHLEGIKAHLEHLAAGTTAEAIAPGGAVSGNPAQAEIAALESVPPPSVWGRLAGWIIPGIIVALIITGFFRLGAGLSLTMLLRWLLWNGSLAALGALIALGHPLSILVSFVGAPIGTLNPFLSVGLFSGIVEASIRKPRVRDAETLSDDVTSLKGLYRNRITRALLVFLLSSLGGAIGNFISIPSLAGLLAG